METKVGQNKVVHTETLILQEGQDARISFAIKGWDVNFQIVFVNDFSLIGPPLISLEAAKDYAIVRFTNWLSPTGTATLQPVQVATVDEKHILLMTATHWKISTVNRLDLQFLLEESK